MCFIRSVSSLTIARQAASAMAIGRMSGARSCTNLGASERRIDTIAEGSLKDLRALSAMNDRIKSLESQVQTLESQLERFQALAQVAAMVNTGPAKPRRTWPAPFDCVLAFGIGWFMYDTLKKKEVIDS